MDSKEYQIHKVTLKKFKNKNLTASSKNWITRQFKDPYTKLAKLKGYRSRSAFKLIEINKKFQFLKNNLNKFIRFYQLNFIHMYYNEL